MQLGDGLRVIQKGHLGWGKCRPDCFVDMLLALAWLNMLGNLKFLSCTEKFDEDSFK